MGRSQNTVAGAGFRNVAKGRSSGGFPRLSTPATPSRCAGANGVARSIATAPVSCTLERRASFERPVGGVESRISAPKNSSMSAGISGSGDDVFYRSLGFGRDRASTTGSARKPGTKLVCSGRFQQAYFCSARLRPELMGAHLPRCESSSEAGDSK